MRIRLIKNPKLLRKRKNLVKFKMILKRYPNLQEKNYGSNDKYFSLGIENDKLRIPKPQNRKGFG